MTKECFQMLSSVSLSSCSENLGMQLSWRALCSISSSANKQNKTKHKNKSNYSTKQSNSFEIDYTFHYINYPFKSILIKIINFLFLVRLMGFNRYLHDFHCIFVRLPAWTRIYLMSNMFSNKSDTNLIQSSGELSAQSPAFT